MAVFAIANFLSSFPYLVMVAGFSTTIVFFMVQLHQGFVHFSYLLLDLLGTIAVVESLMMIVAALVPNFLMGIGTGAAILVRSHVTIFINIAPRSSQHFLDLG